MPKKNKLLMIEKITELVERMKTEHLILSREFGRIVDETGYSVASIRTAYYKKTKENENMAMESNHIDQNIERFLGETSSEKKLEIGSKVDAVITSLHHRIGAFARVEGYHRDILIPMGHIIPVGLVEDISDYLEVGKSYEAVVMQSRRADHDYNLCLKHLNLQPLHEIESNSPMAKLKLVEIKEPKSVVVTDPREKEIQHVMNYLQRIVGVVSPESKERMVSLIERHGIFALGMVMAKVEDKFVADLSHYLLNQLEKAVKDEGL